MRLIYLRDDFFFWFNREMIAELRLKCLYNSIPFYFIESKENCTIWWYASEKKRSMSNEDIFRPWFNMRPVHTLSPACRAISIALLSYAPWLITIINFFFYHHHRHRCRCVMFVEEIHTINKHFFVVFLLTSFTWKSNTLSRRDLVVVIPITHHTLLAYNTNTHACSCTTATFECIQRSFFPLNSKHFLKLYKTITH